MIDKKFGEWLVLEEKGRSLKREKLYLCRCSCGFEKILVGSTLRGGISTQCKKCRMTKFNNVPDLVGMRFGDSIVLKRLENRRRCAYYLIRCGCGREKNALGLKLLSGKGINCPHCRVKTHGMSYTSTFRIWGGILRRCNNPKSDSYKYYGARGIKVCDRWLIFENFLKDMGERPENLSIDRIDNDGDYEPGNCRWATSKVQASNKRRKIA